MSNTQVLGGSAVSPACRTGRQAARLTDRRTGQRTADFALPGAALNFPGQLLGCVTQGLCDALRGQALSFPLR